MAKNKKFLKLSDKALLMKYEHTGKTVYLGELYKRYIPLVYGVCLKYTKDEEMAEESVIQIFDELQREISGNDAGSFQEKLYEITKNSCSLHLQKENRKILIDSDKNSAPSHDDIIYLLEKENNYELTKKLKHCLEKLPDQQRISLIYFFMEDLSYEEISDKTGYTLSHVIQYIREGLNNLKNNIENA